MSFHTRDRQARLDIDTETFELFLNEVGGLDLGVTHLGVGADVLSHSNYVVLVALDRSGPRGFHLGRAQGVCS